MHDGRKSFLRADTLDFAPVGLRHSKTAFIFAPGGIFSPPPGVLVASKNKGHTAIPPGILSFLGNKNKEVAYVSRRLLYHDPF